MGKDTIAELKATFERFFEGEIDAFDDSTSPAQIEKWDSNARIGLLLEIEQHFNLKFTAIELDELGNIGAIRKVLDARRAA